MTDHPNCRSDVRAAPCAHDDVFFDTTAKRLRCVRWSCRGLLPEVGEHLVVGVLDVARHLHVDNCAAVAHTDTRCTCGGRAIGFDAGGELERKKACTHDNRTTQPNGDQLCDVPGCGFVVLASMTEFRQEEHHAGCDLKEKTGHFCTCGADPKAMDKFTTPGGHASLPTPYESELITIGMEEAFEVIAELHLVLTRFGQRSSKGLRFGLDQVEPGQMQTNRERLAKEAGQLGAIVTRMIATKILPGHIVSEASADKIRKLQQYMQYDPGDKR